MSTGSAKDVIYNAQKAGTKVFAETFEDGEFLGPRGTGQFIPRKLSM